MDAALPPIALAVVALCALVVILAALLHRRRLVRRISRAWSEVPRDPETGLFDRTVCLPRIAAELKRASRTGGTVWVGVITVTGGDAGRFGRLLHDSMRLPEVGFRLDEQVVCIARPDLGAEERVDLLGRIIAAAPREQLALGEHVWRGRRQDGDASQLLAAASAATREVFA